MQKTLKLLLKVFILQVHTSLSWFCEQTFLGGALFQGGTLLLRKLQWFLVAYRIKSGLPILTFKDAAWLLPHHRLQMLTL